VTPRFKIIAGVFELRKPYFNFDVHNVDRQLGLQRAKGVELSLTGEPIEHLHFNVGAVDEKVSISGPNIVSEGVGPVALGQPRLTYVANADYTLPWWPTASLDVAATHFGTAPESVDNVVYEPAVTRVNIGGRYKFTAFGMKSSLRVQIQNVLATSEWAITYTPGLFRWPNPRTVFAYLTTDL
jgi:iron complex outermembrane receptor protein